jgi:beta-lactamase class A
LVREIRDLFADAGCRGWLCVREIDGPGRQELDADDVVAAASVYKIALALEFARQANDGRLDPRERFRLEPAGATPGPTGFSGFMDAVEASARDLARMLMTVSDNTASDVLAERVGLDNVHATLRSLGLTQTVIPTLLRDAYAEHPTTEPFHTIRTTAAETAELLRLIWIDQAGPPEACAEVRRLMGAQLTRHRLAAGFGREISIAAKSGSLFGIIRNEAGVIEYPDGGRYAAAVFTRAPTAWVGDNEINAAIGSSAAHAVRSLRSTAQ